MDAKSLGTPQPTRINYSTVYTSIRQHKCRSEERRAALAKKIKLLLACGSEWTVYQEILLHCLRVGDQAALELPAGKRRLLRALAGIREELAVIETLL